MLKVVKIGGAVLDDATKEKEFISEFLKISNPKILIHGGGRYASDLAERLGIKTKMVDGRRITDIDTIEVVKLAFASINKHLAAKIQSKGVDAIGLSGGDLGIINAVKRSHPTIDYGYVGDIQSVNFKKLENLLNLGIVPVICSLTSTDEGDLLNTNADTIASEIAIAGKAEELIYCFEKNGVLFDPGNEEVVIKEIHINEIEGLIAGGTVSTGMIPKLHNAAEAVKRGVVRVRIAKYSNLKSGTIIKL